MNEVYYVSGNKFKLEIAQDFFDKFSKIKPRKSMSNPELNSGFDIY